METDQKPKRKVAPYKYKEAWYPQIAYWMARNGLTDKEISDHLHISRSTLKLWKKRFPEFEAALKKGKRSFDDIVEMCLFHRATGYSYPEDHIMQYKGEPIIVHTMKHVPPDVTAQIWWLKNRRPEKWRDKHEVTLDVPQTFADWMKYELTKNDDGDQKLPE